MPSMLTGVPSLIPSIPTGAFTCDAHHMTEPQPQGKGVILCIERALQATGVAPEQVCRAGFVWTSGTGVKLLDETRLGQGLV